jgi:hypothetical protein
MESMEGNTNAEIWTFDEAKKFLLEAYELSLQDDYDFIGEIARDLKSYREVFKYLSDKFPKLKTTHNKILSNLEANCFSHAKKGKIKEATAIVNLKSNYGWTDRVDNTTKGDKIEAKPLTKEEIKKTADELENGY